MATRGKVIDAQAMSASFTGDEILVQDASVIGVELYSAATGDRAGTINIQESISGDNWASIQLNDSTLGTDTDVPVTASTELLKVYNLAGVGGKFIRIKFTNSAGTTGSLDAYVLTKVR